MNFGLFAGEENQGVYYIVAYYNGLGYPILQITGRMAGDGKAVAIPIVYDKMRRPDAKSYLSYPTESSMYKETGYAIEDQEEYYNSQYGGEAFPSYTHRTFETYSGGRVLSVRRPGLKYKELDKEVRFEYRLNTPEDSVMQLRHLYDHDSGFESVKCTGRYSEQTLSCTRIVNEDTDTSYVFTDPFGRQILSRRINAGERYDTYYVYDLKDSLVCAIQPEGAKVMPEEFPLHGEFAGKWCFTYMYDAFGNVIESHAPGGGYKWTFYDTRDRPVFYTDERMRKDGTYRFLQYDGMNRVVLEAYCTIRKSHEEIMRLLYMETNPYRIMDSISSVLREASYYSASQVPDTSGFRPDRFTDNAAALDMEHCMTLLRGETLYQEPDGSADDEPGYLRKEYFYDSFGRPVQVAETSGDGSKSTYSYKYDFTGNVLVSSEVHERAGGKKDGLVMEYTYDSFGRRTGCLRTLNGKEYPWITYTYDGLGRMESVSVEDRVMETYAYDLQGALSRLGSEAYGESAFLQVLKYYDPSLTVSVPSYSGRISEIGYADAMQDWQYISYWYDHAGRLSDTQRTGDDREPYGEYEERDMKYDANGNLLSMKRIMSAGNSAELSFGYSGNRMESVSEGDSLFLYSFDSAGNMVIDGRRGLELSYNFLNLPSGIRIKDSASLVYSYLSDGTMTSVTDSLAGKGLKFRGSFIYTVSPDGDEAVESIGYGEGRFYARKHEADSADFADAWFVRDYLGSVRMVADITDPDTESLSDAVLSRSDYLPFGMPFSPAVYTGRTEQAAIPQSALSRWQFNGKPEQVAGLADTGLLDYGARLYDPFTARWNSVDPLADKYPGTSPYAFCADDPVNLIDPDGMDANIFYNDSTKTITVTTIIYIYGELATEKLAKTYENSIYNSWGTFKEIKIDNNWYKLNWNISVVNLGKDSGFIEKNGNNYMKVSNDQSYIKGKYQGKIRLPKNAGDTPMAHEFGHMIGLRDRYIKQGDRTYPERNWEGNIMAEEAGLGIVEPQNILDALSAAVKSLVAGETVYRIPYKQKKK